jgi:hypothetical protein
MRSEAALCVGGALAARLAPSTRGPGDGAVPA